MDCMLKAIKQSEKFDVPLFLEGFYGHVIDVLTTKSIQLT